MAQVPRLCPCVSSSTCEAPEQQGGPEIDDASPELPPMVTRDAQGKPRCRERLLARRRFVRPWATMGSRSSPEVKTAAMAA